MEGVHHMDSCEKRCIRRSFHVKFLRSIMHEINGLFNLIDSPQMSDQSDFGK